MLLPAALNNSPSFSTVIRSSPRTFTALSREAAPLCDNLPVVLHNEEKKMVRAFKLKAWITCVLKFRGRHREVMMPNRWTELFFLDEATAFAAGHRPCFQCRYADHQHFKTAWLKGNRAYGFDEKISIHKIDEVLHRQRIDNGRKVTYKAAAGDLPNGTFIRFDSDSYLVYNERLYQWTPFGYESAELHIDNIKEAEVVTPLSIVNTFRAGYTPQIAISL